MGFPTLFYLSGLFAGQTSRFFFDVHLAQKSRAKFVQNYLLTFSRKYGIMIIEREGKSMTVENLINYYLGVEEVNSLENTLEKIIEIDENISVKKLLEIIKKPIDK